MIIGFLSQGENKKVFGSMVLDFDAGKQVSAKRISDACLSRGRRSRLGCLKDQVAELGASVGYKQAYTAQGIIGGWGVLFGDNILASLLVKVSITTTPHAQYSLCSMMTQYSLFQVVESGKSVWRFFWLTSSLPLPSR